MKYIRSLIMVKTFRVHAKPAAVEIGRDTQGVPKPPKYLEFSKPEAGRRVRALRESRGMTQVELAKALGMPQSNVSEIERGGRGLTVHQTVKLARALKVSTDDILLGKNGHRVSDKATPSLKILRRLQGIERLPEARQRVVLKLVDALIQQEAGR